MRDVCALCGGAIEPRTGTGREVVLSAGPYRVPDDYGMPTCIVCGAEWINGDTIFDLIKLRTAAALAAFGKANRKE